MTRSLHFTKPVDLHTRSLHVLNAGHHRIPVFLRIGWALVGGGVDVFAFGRHQDCAYNVGHIVNAADVNTIASHPTFIRMIDTGLLYSLPASDLFWP